MSHDRPTLGILLMLGFCVVAPMGDAAAKLAGAHVGPAQLVFVRFAIQVVILAPIIWATARSWRMPKGSMCWVLARTVLHVLGIAMMVTALQYLPLADAVAIAFVMPFIMLVLGHFVLGEEVGIRRLMACIVGFAGTLMVVQPAFQEVGYWALLPIGVAINFAFFMLITRQIAKDVDPISMQAVSGVWACVLMAPVLLFLGDAGIAALQWQAVGPDVWGMLACLGLFGTIGHLMMTWSLRYAPSATVAPMQYLEIPFATLIGLAVFGDFPNRLALVGIAITLLAGVYIVLREERLRRLEAVPPAAP
ncbi:MAG: DMT family transporter [Paracoccaceae bacterium]